MKKQSAHVTSMLLPCLIVVVFNVYFIFLVPNGNLFYIYYIDFLLFVCIGIAWFIQSINVRKQRKNLNEYLSLEEVIYPYLEDLTDQEIIEHDVTILKKQMEEQIQINHELQDYITKWCHEVKIPLSAISLMNEKNEDEQLRTSMNGQLERIRQYVNNAMIGCKVQSKVFDLQMKEVKLLDCVKASIKNNQYFLIQHHFELSLHDLDVIVYSDQEWLIYVLDQLLANAVKYCEDSPVLHIWATQEDSKRQLHVEDHGIGIKDQDLRTVFDRGFTGTNHHNGSYKSTGMGLYLAKMITDRLSHELKIESVYGEYTRCTITFYDHRDYFLK